MSQTRFGEKVEKRLVVQRQLFSERNSVYQDNWRKVGKVMEALYPDGITLRDQHDFNRHHILELMVVKLTRYTAVEGGHPDSLDDLGVYAAILAEIDQEILRNLPETEDAPESWETLRGRPINPKA